MRITSVIALAALSTVAQSQTYTLSGCHRHGSVEYCYLPDGTETPWTTYAESATATPTSTSASASTTAPEAEPTVTEVTGCHGHGDTLFCMVGSDEYEVLTDVDIDNAPEVYSGCHNHGEEIHCTGGDAEITLAPMAAESGGEVEHAHGTEPNAEGISCHEHVGVQHCVDANGKTVEGECVAPDREYNVPLRIGMLFVVLVTSGLGVFAPILTSKFTNLSMDHVVILAMRCFGCGVIISTAVIHLFTHAQLYFSSECVGLLEYEATTGAILLAGLFLTFLIEYLAHRLSEKKASRSRSAASPEVPNDAKDAEVAAPEVPAATENLTLKTELLEAGVIFHSILIGLTLVVASDGSSFSTLSCVIVFHQVFEGFALGARIAMCPISFLHKSVLALGFAITTPIGMAIGIGVLSSFNGNDPSTIIAIGTLNAFSAGILLWVGIAEMWFAEWFQGALAHSGIAKTSVCFLGLVSGLVLMSVLGKWA